MNLVQKALASFGQYMRRGVYHTLGADPISVADTGTEVWNLFGRKLTRVPLDKPGGSLVPHLAGKAEISMQDLLGTVPMMIGTALNVGTGYAAGGLGGALSMLTADVAANAAMAKYGYKWKNNNAGIRTSHRKAGGLPAQFLRYGMASGFSLGAMNMVGGGIPGFFAASAGAYVGARGGLPLAGLYAGYQGAKLVAKGTGSVLKAGRDFRRRQRSIDTSGSLAAFNTQGAYTMRERAVQAIHKSHLNARSALGQEASYLHYPSRNYHSRYRM